MRRQCRHVDCATAWYTPTHSLIPCATRNTISMTPSLALRHYTSTWGGFTSPSLNMTKNLTSTQIQRSGKNRWHYAVVNNHQCTILVRNFSYLPDIGYHLPWIRGALKPHDFSFGSDCCPNFIQIASVYSPVEEHSKPFSSIHKHKIWSIYMRLALLVPLFSSNHF